MFIETLSTSAIAAAETSLNQLLSLDPVCLQQLSQHSGKVFAIECSNPTFNLYLIPCDSGLLLQQHFEGTADASIIGSAQQLTALMLAKDKTAAMRSQGIQLSGDTRFAQQLQDIFSQLELDWEGLVAKATGDVIAHQLGNVARSVGNWGQQAGSSLSQDLTEYLQEEARVLPSRNEVEAFYDDLSELRLESDRLSAKIQRIQQAIENNSTDSIKDSHKE